LVAACGKLTTRWIGPASSRDGYRVVAESPGLFIAVGADVWHWTAGSEKVPTGPCSDFSKPAGKGTGTRAVAERLGSEERVTIVTPAKGGREINEIEHHALPIASLGPYLFLRESTAVDACRAHGTTEVSLIVWDLASRGYGDLLTPDEKSELDSTARLEAQRRLPPFDDGKPLRPQDVLYRGSLPRFGPRGELGVEHAFSTYTCYACPDFVWGSYSVSVNVPAQRVPERARAYERPPAVVAAWLASHPEVKLAGWSELSAAAARTLAPAMKAAPTP
jgi:hypothetical protein